MELKSTKDIISNLKEMLRGSTQTEDLKNIAVQTDKNSNSCLTKSDKKDVQVQVNRGFTSSKIKKEPQVAIPNRPSSNGGTQGKKRKMASNQIQRKTRPQDDVSILNPQLYKTYCSQSDPEKAREAIRKMKYCSRVMTIKAVDDTNDTVRETVQSTVKSIIDDYWPPSDNKGIEYLKSVFEDYSRWYEEDHKADLIYIDMLTITGTEIWVVEDFDKGHKESKWFRKIFKLMPILLFQLVYS